MSDELFMRARLVAGAVANAARPGVESEPPATRQILLNGIESQ